MTGGAKLPGAKDEELVVEACEGSPRQEGRRHRGQFIIYTYRALINTLSSTVLHFESVIGVSLFKCLLDYPMILNNLTYKGHVY